MRIHRICLENWGQHSHLELEFPPTGVISLTGPNDSGKSTLLSAIGWVLSPNARNRYGDRNDIQDGQTSAAVTLEFSLEDNLHQPTRHTLRKQIIVGENPALRANPETTITLDGEILTGPQWEEFLMAKAQLDESSQFLALMIAPQEEIHALLRSPLGTRNKELRESLGIALPDFWNETLKEEVTNWAEKYAQRAGAIQRALSDSETRLQELHQAQEKYQLQLAELPQAETVSEQIREIEQDIQQLNTYEQKRRELERIAHELHLTETQKREIREQRTGHLPAGDHSSLDLRQAKLELRLLILAECQQRANRTETLLQQATTQAAPPWPTSIEQKQALRTSIHTQQEALQKRIIQNELLQQQIEKLQGQINPQYAPLENEAESLEAFYQAATYHTSQPDRPRLRKIPLKDLRTRHQQQISGLAKKLSQLQEERHNLTIEQGIDPFSGTEAADTLLKLWRNRTPQDRCILTGSDLSHLKEEIVTEKAESLRALPLVTGAAALATPSEQAAYLSHLARLTGLNQEIIAVQNQATQQNALLQPLIETLQSLPSEKWLNISIEAIGSCLVQIKRNLEYRRQIRDYESNPDYSSASLLTDKAQQPELQRQKSELENGIRLQLLLAETREELKKLNHFNTKLDLARSTAQNHLIAQSPESSLSAPSTPLTELLQLPPHEIRQQIETLDQIIQSEEQIRETTAALEQKIQVLKDNLQNTENACTELKSALEAAQIDVREPTELERQKTEALEKLKTIQQLHAVNTQNESELRKTLEVRQRLQKEEQDADTEKDNLQAAKDAADFFAPRRTPKQLLRAALQEIVQETNRILPETGLEMELSVSAEMDFEVSFERAQKHITEPARRLGCGLATLVGMCLKMALARILQPNLKFLAFDEPSAQLDPLKKQAFSQFLKSLSRQALTGNQILVIEHDLAIAHSCDHQIQLT